MKKAVLTVLQFVLFFLAFAVGSFSLHPKLQQTLSVTPNGTRVVVWDGIVLMALLFVVILVIEAARKRIRISAPWTALAALLATVAGLALKFGLLTVETAKVFRQY